MTTKNIQSVQVDNSSRIKAAQLQHVLEDDRVIGGLLILLTLLSRLPFRSQILYHWDSVNFAYAMRQFDLAKEQPQPPGYILYVWFSRLVDLIFSNPQTTMVVISMIASALSVTAIYFLGKAIFGRQVGLVAALFMAFSPLFWFYGEIALPHTLDTLLVLLSVWWLYETMKGDLRFLYPAIVVLAIAGGVRQQTLVFLFPVALFAMRRVGWRRFLISGVIGVVICLIWFVPLISLSNGISNYMSIMGAFSQRFQATTSIFDGAGFFGLRRNIIKLSMYTFYGWGIALIPAVAYLFVMLRRRAWPVKWDKMVFIGLWALPAVLFYTFIHMGQQGLVFVFLPVLILLSAVGVVRWLDTSRSRWAMVAGVLCANIIIFCLAPEYPLGINSVRLLTFDTLRNSDQYYQDRFEAIKENFDPQSAVILSSDWHHVNYYLPDYKVLPFTLGSKWEVDAGIPENGNSTTVITPDTMSLTPKPSGQITAIIFDPDIEKFNQSPDLVQKLSLPDGEYLDYMEFNSSDPLYVNPASFGLRSK